MSEISRSSIDIPTAAFAAGLGAACLSWYIAKHASSKGPLSLADFLRNLVGGGSGRRKPPIDGLPDPDPYLDFDLATATTRNHLYVNKTVRHPYFQTMAHQPMNINNWIEIDKDFDWYLSEKKRIIQENGKTVVDSLPENDEAAGELLELLVDYLPKRYPTLFTALPDGIHNLVTDERITGASKQRGVDALISCSKLVEDDFLMAREREDGHVYFVGGLVTMPGFYLLSEKIGKSMYQTHMPVPQFNEKLLISVERTLKRFQPHEPFERTSWEIVDDRNLFWHNIASLGPGETLPEKQHPRDLFFRVDHQTFRKLPRSRGIIFGVHPIMKRLEDLRDDPLVPALLAKVHLEADEKLMKYKAADAYQVPMMDYLAELTKSQIERGLIKGDENIADFRALVDRPPSTQSSLRKPTASELAIGGKTP